MLSFDAVGRLALGQVYQAGVTTISLAATSGAFVVSGAAAFRLTLASDLVSYSVNGVSSPLTTRMSGASASYATTGYAASFNSQLTSQQALYVVSGIDAALGAGGLPAATGSFSFVGNAALFQVFGAADVFAFNVTGISADFALGLEDWVPVIGQDEIWIPSSADADIWTPAVKQDEVWSMVS